MPLPSDGWNVAGETRVRYYQSNGDVLFWKRALKYAGHIWNYVIFLVYWRELEVGLYPECKADSERTFLGHDLLAVT